jgi:hypothetical protein
MPAKTESYMYGSATNELRARRLELPIFLTKLRCTVGSKLHSHRARKKKRKPSKPCVTISKVIAALPVQLEEVLVQKHGVAEALLFLFCKARRRLRRFEKGVEERKHA